MDSPEDVAVILMCSLYPVVIKKDSSIGCQFAVVTS